MENWIKVKNNSKINLGDIPVLKFEDLRYEIVSACNENGLRPVGFFGQNIQEGVKLFVTLADDKNSRFLISSSIFNKKREYESITKNVPSFHIFEREFFEQFNIEPKSHPWLKPVRKNQDNYEFFEMEGDEVHQVAVGPIHAGVIEPGHFRFMCNGETVYHLEIMLGYQHRGVEDLMVKQPSIQLAESITGDSVIAYATAYSNIIETLSDTKISKKAALIRKAALEMERTAVHIGDLGAIAGDIAYLMGASVFGAQRTLVINSTLELCGSRFGRGFITNGGVNFDVTKEAADKIIKTLDSVLVNVTRMVKTMLKNSTVMSRLEKTGTVKQDTAKEIGLVGMAAKASNINLDTRFDFPDDITNELELTPKPFKGKGDVNSRFKLRFKEIEDSISFLKKIFEKIKEEEGEILTEPNSNLCTDSFAISAVEGWRGEIIHIALTDKDGKISRYKIKDPSFNNWYGLALAVRNNGISDFPLCNKSFNLSYSGFDL